MKTKLSELTYEILCREGLSGASMHVDCTDGLLEFRDALQFERAKALLLAAYGDVDLVISIDADWFDQISIDDDKWRADHEAFCREKAAWLKEFGCD